MFSRGLLGCVRHSTHQNASLIKPSSIPSHNLISIASRWSPSQSTSFRCLQTSASRLQDAPSSSQAPKPKRTTNRDLRNVIDPNFKSDQSPTSASGTNEQVVLWKIYANFHRHNTLLSLVAVVEDLDFMEKNKHLSYNEQVLYYMQLPHRTKFIVSAGQLGFRKAQRAEYEAAYQVTTRFFKMIEDRKLIGHNDKVELVMKDYGRGREAFLAALQGKEGSNISPQIIRISDSTKLRFGGARPKKLRRLG